jgi:hypothetical protein
MTESRVNLVRDKDKGRFMQAHVLLGRVASCGAGCAGETREDALRCIKGLLAEVRPSKVRLLSSYFDQGFLDADQHLECVGREELEVLVTALRQQVTEMGIEVM